MNGRFMFGNRGQTLRTFVSGREMKSKDSNARYLHSEGVLFELCRPASWASPGISELGITEHSASHGAALYGQRNVVQLDTE
jgi:hypothetical protein